MSQQRKPRPDASFRAQGLTDQAAEVQKAYCEVFEWRVRHLDECKMPDHAHVAAGEPGSGSERA